MNYKQTMKYEIKWNMKLNGKYEKYEHMHYKIWTNNELSKSYSITTTCIFL